MKKTVWAFLLISALMLVSCTQVTNFDTSDFIPPNAQDIKVQDVDFDGDGSSEKVISYTSDVTVDRESKTTYEHLVILANKNSKWQIVKEDAFAYNNVPVRTHIKDQKVIDFSSDGKQELFVQWAPIRTIGIGSYYVIAFVNGEYTFIDSPLLNEHAYLQETKDETEMHLTAVAPTSDGIKESYTIFCENDLKGKPQVSRYSKSCRNLDLQVSFNNGTLKRQ